MHNQKPLKKALVFVAKAVLGGLLVIVPIYLAVLVLLKGMKSVGGLVRPFALLLPDWIPAEKALSLLLVLLICFLIGVAVRTRAGRVGRERIERGFFERIPGYALFRGLTQQVAGKSRETSGSQRWPRSKKPSSPHSSLRSSRTGATRFLSHRSPPRLLAPSTFSTGDECIPWTSLSLMPSKPSPGRAQVRRILWWLWRKGTGLRATTPPSRELDT
jgi:hypothetical protein